MADRGVRGCPVHVARLVVVSVLLAASGRPASAICSHEDFWPYDGPLTSGQVGVYYSQFYEYDCGDSYVSWQLTSGMLPPGLTLVPDPVNRYIWAYLQGTPTTAGTFSYSLTATADWTGDTHTFNNTITIDNPPGCGTIALAPSSLPNGTYGVPYSQTVTATGGAPPYAFSVSWGTLPPGLSLSSSGVLSGTPSYAGTFNFWITATDASGCTGSNAYSIAISANCNVAITPATLPVGTIWEPYSVQMAGQGGNAPYSFARDGGAFPPGIWMAASGLIDGIPTTGGFFQFSLRVTDAAGCEAVQPFFIAVQCRSTIWPPSLPPGTAGVPYQMELLGFGGTPPYSFRVSAGALPAGLTLDTDGMLSGTATGRGMASFTIEMRDAASCPRYVAYNLRMEGLVDHVVGQGRGMPDPNRIEVLTRSGRTAVDFFAYGTGTYGVAVASGDLDADLAGEILSGPGPGPVHGPHVRTFRRDGTPIAKVSYYAYATLRYGVNLASADLEGDSFDEILTAPGPGAVFAPHVRGWDVDGGAARAVARVNFDAFSTLAYGAVVGSGDVDGCQFPEILAAAGPGPALAASVRGFYYRGGSVVATGRLSFLAFATGGYGASVRAGDVDSDGYDEILCARGPGPALASEIRGFDFDDRTVTGLPGFDVLAFGTAFGATLGGADVTADGRDDLLAGAGPDPAAPARVKVFEYTGGGLVQDKVFLLPFPGSGYGVEVAAGNLDHR